MRITSKGQVTIPRQVRRQLGPEPGDEVEIVIGDDGEARTRPANSPRTGGERIVAALTGNGDGTLTTDEIMALTRGE